MNFTEVFVSPPGDCRRMNHSARSEDDGLSSCHDNYRPTMHVASCGQQSGEVCISLGGQKQRNPAAERTLRPAGVTSLDATRGGGLRRTTRLGTGGPAWARTRNQHLMRTSRTSDARQRKTTPITFVRRKPAPVLPFAYFSYLFCLTRRLGNIPLCVNAAPPLVPPMASGNASESRSSGERRK